MGKLMSRRTFLGGSMAFLVAGWRNATELFGTPELQFGVLSDVHITTPQSVAVMEKAFAWFRQRGADAVMMPGDLTDWGLCRSFDYLEASWEKYFKDGKTVPLFCTGNHDYEGWRYADMAMEMFTNGYSKEEALCKCGLERYWEKTFGEKFAPVRVRTVKGYDFVSAEWRAEKDVPAWLAANGSRLRGKKPFFYFQHVPINGTTGDSRRNGSKDPVYTALKAFPNAIAFTGHTHTTFNDERSVWQGDFTAFAVPSLSYAGLPWVENGSGLRNGKAKKTMPALPYRRDLRGGQGYYVSVYSDKMVVERIDVEEGCVAGAEAWVVPLGSNEKPFAPSVRAAASVAPKFPAGARVRTETRNADSRIGKWAIVMNCTFESAVPFPRERVHHYEIAAVPKDGSKSLVKRFLSPAFAKMAKYEPKVQRFWLNAAELPRGTEYVLQVRAVNCYGKRSAPLISRVWRSATPSSAGKGVKDTTAETAAGSV